MRTSESAFHARAQALIMFLPNEPMRSAQDVARPSSAAGSSTVSVRVVIANIDWRRDAARTRRRGRPRYVKITKRTHSLRKLNE